MTSIRARKPACGAVRRVLAIVLCIASWSCASYPERTQLAYADFERGHLSQAYDAYTNRKTTGSEFLSGAEAGTVALANGQWDDAVQQFGRAMSVVEDAEREALLSAGNLEDWMLSWTLNEGAQRYVGEGYERALVHACSAAARLARGDLDGARVETKRANALLESEEALYKKEYRAGGLGHFLSAIVYELDGKPDDAYIDYARMEAKGVGVALASRALVRLARVLGRTEELARWTEKYGADDEAVPGNASVIVIAGVGEGPYKQEITFPIPTPDGILQWSVPTYARRAQCIGDLELSVAGGSRSVRTIVIEDIGAVAKENLDDRILLLSTKSAVRAVLKRELTKQLEKDVGVLGRIAGDIFTFLTERADLRSWLTLPDTWQAARAFVPAGEQRLILDARGGERAELGSYELAPGETVFVFARTIGTRLYAHVVGGKRLDSGAPVALEGEARVEAVPAGEPR